MADHKEHSNEIHVHIQCTCHVVIFATCTCMSTLDAVIVCKTN